MGNSVSVMKKGFHCNSPIIWLAIRVLGWHSKESLLTQHRCITAVNIYMYLHYGVSLLLRPRIHYLCHSRPATVAGRDLGVYRWEGKKNKSPSSSFQCWTTLRCNHWHTINSIMYCEFSLYTSDSCWTLIWTHEMHGQMHLQCCTLMSLLAHDPLGPYITHILLLEICLYLI